MHDETLRLMNQGYTPVEVGQLQRLRGVLLSHRVSLRYRHVRSERVKRHELHRVLPVSQGAVSATDCGQLAPVGRRHDGRPARVCAAPPTGRTPQDRHARLTGGRRAEAADG